MRITKLENLERTRLNMSYPYDKETWDARRPVRYRLLDMEIAVKETIHDGGMFADHFIKEMDR